MRLVFKREYMKAVYQRYHRSNKKEKGEILNEFCQTYKCHRKHGIRLLNGRFPEEEVIRRGCCLKYDARVLKIIEDVWEAAGYPWSVRLKEVIRLWLPNIREKFKTTPEIEEQLLTISSAQIDRRLKDKKIRLRKRIYGTTKPGSLLKRHIEVRTVGWDTKEPGWLENDLVSHSGSNASGNYAYTLNVVDIASTWTSRRAVLGKGEKGICNALDKIICNLPFKTLGIDSDNGSEFINEHLCGYCETNKIIFTRSREYKKDDNAHIEQKNYTHVRKIVGYARYDSIEAVMVMNDLYIHELDLFQNLFQPSVKLQEKVRIGSRIKRIYDKPKTPLDRLIETGKYNQEKVQYYLDLRRKLNPFELARIIEEKIERIYSLANRSVKSAFCPKNVYRPRLVRMFIRPVKDLGPGIGETKIFPDCISKLKQIYHKEVLLETR